MYNLKGLILILNVPFSETVLPFIRSFKSLVYIRERINFTVESIFCVTPVASCPIVSEGLNMQPTHRKITKYLNKYMIIRFNEICKNNKSMEKDIYCLTSF